MAVIIFAYFFSDLEHRYTGRWQGGRWTCDKPLKLSFLNMHGLDWIGEYYKFNEQHDALLLGPSGPFLVANQDGSGLTYSDPNGDGQTFDLLRCN